MWIASCSYLDISLHYCKKAIEDGVAHSIVMLVSLGASVQILNKGLSCRDPRHIVQNRYELTDTGHTRSGWNDPLLLHYIITITIIPSFDRDTNGPNKVMQQTREVMEGSTK